MTNHTEQQLNFAQLCTGQSNKQQQNLNLVFRLAFTIGRFLLLSKSLNSSTYTELIQ